MNTTIETQLNHRSIRKFSDKPISPEIIEVLVDVARHTATSSFTQSYSIISVTDPIKKQALAEIGKQPYIAEAAHLFVLVVDQHRNEMIAKANGADTSVLDSFDRFFVGASDAILAAQNMMVAAESLGIGGVFLGSILNQIDEVSSLLNLPERVAPALGIAFGYPDQSPQLKPRIPANLIHFENSYPEYTNILDTLKEYDEIVQTYYDLRNANQRIDSFTNQITAGMGRINPGRAKMLEYLQKQKLVLK